MSKLFKSNLNEMNGVCCYRGYTKVVCYTIVYIV